MDKKVIPLILICFAIISSAGCMTQSPVPAGTPAVPAVLPQTSPAATISPAQAAECTVDADCVPAECCHPSGCTAASAKQPCNLMCTAGCTGPLDCGAGSCGCVKGKCSVMPAPPAPSTPTEITSITIKAAPLRYSPIMSSTPGIGLEPAATGFSAGNASFTWRATYGQFLSWNPPDYQVRQLGDSTTNHGEKLYWSFTDRPASLESPVTITITATDPAAGRLLGSSTVSLAWEGNYSVNVTEIR